MKKLSLSLFLLCFATVTQAQSTCNNLDFENLNYTGWSTYLGGNNSSTLAPANVSPYTNASTTGANVLMAAHALVYSNSSYQGVNLTSGFQGSVVARVNDWTAGAKASVLERTFTVSPNQPLVNFSYLFFSDAGAHGAADQPYLDITVLDQNNQVIPSSSLHIVALSNMVLTPGFTTTPNSTQIVYKPWTPVTLNLSQYIGQTVKMRIIAADCNAGGHGGMAYIDFDCGGATASVPHVWPGDANYDLTVDFLDMFYVGAANSLQGAARASQGTTWVAATSNNWYLNSLYLVDAKHADCDGNGTVNSNDLSAISTNYNSTHPFKLIKPEVLVLKSAANVPLTIVPNNSSVSTNQSLSLDFMIGNSQVPVDSIFAIGFNMEYPDNLFDANQTVFDCSASVIGNITNNLWSIKHDHAGSVDLAVCRNDQQNVKNIVNGKIFSLSLTTKANLTTPATMNFSITNVVALDRSGKQLNLTSSPASVQLTTGGTTVGMKEISGTSLSIGPNPANEELNYRLSTNEKGVYAIYSVDGRVLVNGEITASEGKINTAKLNTGVYFLTIELSNGQSITRKFLKEQTN